MSFNFVADRIVKDRAYPAFAQHQAEPYTLSWRQFAHYWPNTVPCELHEHCANHNYPYSISTDSGDYYTIGLGFFDFTIDYFSLIPEQIFKKNITVLFYYHEGDNPYLIKQRLDALCKQHNLSPNCYRFITGNTAADTIKNFVWFPDHELLYWHRNQQIKPANLHLNTRPYDFTLLSRTHKWWRATAVTDLQRTGLLSRSQWSYNTISINDQYADNPIEVDRLDVAADLTRFVDNAPYTCDNLTADEHNDHHLTELIHYTDSYFNIVLETHFDADQSSGAFLTEKTFKPIKHAQPFVVVGAVGSLAALRSLGYRTFDSVLDNTYDTIQDNTKRWLALRELIAQIKQNPGEYFNACLADILHNQQLFASSKYARLDHLYKQLKQS